MRKREEAAGDIYDDGYLRVEFDNYYVSCGGRFIKLSRKEFLIFSRLVRMPERIVSPDELWRSAWGQDQRFNPVSIHVYIHRLRVKLAPYGLLIDTMVNVGYRLLAGANQTNEPLGRVEPAKRLRVSR